MSAFGPATPYMLRCDQTTEFHYFMAQSALMYLFGSCVWGSTAIHNMVEGKGILSQSIKGGSNIFHLKVKTDLGYGHLPKLKQHLLVL